MVLWEITLATAYFLGLKRTYRLALKIQRRLITSRYPKIRQFAHRRTRAVFDVALRVHYKIQERDIEVGRNLGNWILRWLDRFKPSAHIRGPPPDKPSLGGGGATGSSVKTPADNGTSKSRGPPGGRNLFTRYENSQWSRAPIAGVSMMRVPKPLGNNTTQYRHVSVATPPPRGVFRKDIMEWMQRR